MDDGGTLSELIASSQNEITVIGCARGRLVFEPLGESVAVYAESADGQVGELIVDETDLIALIEQAQALVAAIRSAG